MCLVLLGFCMVLPVVVSGWFVIGLRYVVCVGCRCVFFV